jgi:hypothetical protein
MKMILAFLLVSCAVVPLSLFADERADVFKELGVLKKDYRKRISEIRKAGNDELKTEQKKSYQAISAVGKGIEEHPGLAAQRKARDEAKAAYQAALKAKDAEAIKAARRAKRDADGALTRDGFKLKEIQDLQAASVAQRKKVEALQYRLVAASGDEGKALIEKIKSLEARYEELRK